MGPNYVPGEKKDLSIKSVQRTVLCMGRKQEAVESGARPAARPRGAGGWGGACRGGRGGLLEGGGRGRRGQGLGRAGAAAAC
jgi:hypothetical protein